MTSRFVMFACFVTGIGCGPAVEEDPAAETGSTSLDEESTGTTAGGTTPSAESTGEASTSTATTNPNPTTASAEGSSSGGESSSGEPFEADCPSLCTNLVEGSCIGLEDSCALTCEDVVGAQGDAVAAAFEVCVSTQPLCFSFLEDCMWSGLYGDEAVEQRYVLEGSGFDAWEGRTVHGVLLVNGEALPEASASVEGGQFTVESTVTAPFDIFSNQRSFTFFVDADDDGLCTDADYVQSAWLQNLGSDFSEPVFVLEATPEAESSVGLCNQF